MGKAERAHQPVPGRGKVRWAEKLQTGAMPEIWIENLVKDFTFYRESW
jgi:hypothetical protein